MSEIIFLRSRAVRCRYLADIATNREVTKELDQLALELEERAASIEAQHSSKQER
jgi:hypothetical protein